MNSIAQSVGGKVAEVKSSHKTGNEPPPIIKLVFEISKKTFPTDSTFIRASEVFIFGIVTDCEPSFAVLASNVVWNVFPPSVDFINQTSVSVVPFL